MVQSLLGFLNLCLNVCSPSQVLRGVYTEVLEAAHPLHRGSTAHKRSVVFWWSSAQVWWSSAPSALVGSSPVFFALMGSNPVCSALVGSSPVCYALVGSNPVCFTLVGSSPVCSALVLYSASFALVPGLGTSSWT